MKTMKYRITINTADALLEVPKSFNQRCAEGFVEVYLRDGYRHPEPDGWVYYPPHVILSVAMKVDNAE